MNYPLLQSILKENDEELTENGLSLKRLAERLQDDNYEMTESDKEIMDQKWRKIWKDN